VNDASCERRSRPAWWAELGAAIVVAAVYLTSSPAEPTPQLISEASARASWVHGLERSLGLDVGPGLQSAVADLGVQWVANVLYGSLHFVVTTLVFVVLYVRRPDRYERWRTAFVLCSVAAFVLQRLVPVAPPRLVEDVAGTALMDDWLAEHPALWDFEQGVISEAANHYAAMPSMHVGWATLSAVGLVWAFEQSGPVRVVAVLYPLLVAVVVVVTGNHFVLDALGGAVVAATGVIAVSAGRRLVQRTSSTRRSVPGRSSAGT
jgi:membrane-associated phospholipid phosphatase